MIKRILEVLETAKVDGKQEQWFGYPFFPVEVAHLTSLGYEVKVTWEPEHTGQSIVKWENK